MLEKVQHIEGLDAHLDHELFDDTHPGSCIVKFDVVSEDMPFLTAQAGKRVTKSFVYIYKEKDLGQMKQRRRIRDKVRFDSETGKWVVELLAPGEQSDIRRYPNEWNAFYRGTAEEVTGAPLSILFRTDPSRTEFYKDHHIETIERLARLTQSESDSLGMGVNDDVKKAQMYLKKIENQAPALEMNFKLEEKEKRIQSLEAQLADLSAKLTEVLQNQIEAASKSTAKPKKPLGRPKKTIQEPVPDGIEGLEGRE